MRPIPESESHSIVTRLARRFTQLATLLCTLGVVLLSGCTRVPEATPYSATGVAAIEQGTSFTEGRLAAVQRAEKLARDRILLYVMDMEFPNGLTLDEAAVTDPFIQAKVYDTIRIAKITDQTVSEDGLVTVTVQLDLKPILEILKNPDYIGGVSPSGTASK